MSWKFGEVVLARKKLGHYNLTRQYLRTSELDRFVILWSKQGVVSAVIEEVFLEKMKVAPVEKKLTQRRLDRLFRGYDYTYPINYFRSERVHVEGLRGLL